MKKATSFLRDRPFVGALLVSLALLTVASIVAVRTTVIAAGHVTNAPNATWPFLALLAVTCAVAVLAVLANARMSVSTLRGRRLATGIGWTVATAAGLQPFLSAAALYTWTRWLEGQGWTEGLTVMLKVATYIGRPVDAIVHFLTGSSPHYTNDLLPGAFVELWLLTGVVSVVLWSALGMVLLVGVRRVARDVRSPASHSS